MASWWVLDVWNGPGGPPLLLAWVMWVILSITLHELAHGWAAIGRGDTTPIDTGHMTWNPLVHMGQMSLLMFAVTGIAWGAMPVNPSRMRGRHADAWVSFAGPLMNFSLAVLCILASATTIVAMGAPVAGARSFGSTAGNLLLFFSVGCSLNVLLGIFNLLPAPPLDGSRILASFSRQYRESMSTSAGQFAGTVLFLLAFFFAGRFIGDWGMRTWGLGTSGIVMALHAMGIGAGGGGGGGAGPTP
jgi:Zn-dependent protease